MLTTQSSLRIIFARGSSKIIQWRIGFVGLSSILFSLCSLLFRSVVGVQVRPLMGDRDQFGEALVTGSNRSSVAFSTVGHDSQQFHLPCRPGPVQRSLRADCRRTQSCAAWPRRAGFSFLRLEGVSPSSRCHSVPGDPTGQSFAQMPERHP